MQLVNDQLNYFSMDEASKCKLFALTLVIPARLWFNGLLDGSIESLTNLCKRFSAHLRTLKIQLVMVVALSGIVQGKKKHLKSYFDHFTQVIVKVEGAKDYLKCLIFQNDLRRDLPLKVRTTQEMMNMAQSYMILQEKLNIQFNNLTSVDVNSSCPTIRDSHRWKGESDRGMH